MDHGDVIIEGTKRNKFDSVSLVYIKRQIISSFIGYTYLDPFWTEVLPTWSGVHSYEYGVINNFFLILHAYYLSFNE